MTQVIRVLQIQGGVRFARLADQRWHRSEVTTSAGLAATILAEGTPVLLFWHIHPGEALPLLRGIHDQDVWKRLHGIVFFRGSQHAGLETLKAVQDWRREAAGLPGERLHILALGVQPRIINPTADFYVNRFVEAVERQAPNDLPPFTLLEPAPASRHLIAAFLVWQAMDAGLWSAEQLQDTCEWSEVLEAARGRNFVPLPRSPRPEMVRGWRRLIRRERELSFPCGDLCQRRGKCLNHAAHLADRLSKSGQRRDTASAEDIAALVGSLRLICEPARELLGCRGSWSERLAEGWRSATEQLPLRLTRDQSEQLGRFLADRCFIDCPLRRRADEVAQALAEFVAVAEPLADVPISSAEWGHRIAALKTAVARLLQVLPCTGQFLDLEETSA